MHKGDMIQSIDTILRKYHKDVMRSWGVFSILPRSFSFLCLFSLDWVSVGGLDIWLMAAIEHLSYTAPSTRTSQPPEPEMQIIREQRARGWLRRCVLAENSVTSLYFQSTVKIDKCQIQERNSVKKWDV